MVAPRKPSSRSCALRATPRVGRPTRSDAARQGAEVQGVAGGSDGVGEAGGPEQAFRRRMGVEQRCLYQVRTGLPICCRDFQSDVCEAFDGRGEPDRGGSRDGPGIERTDVLHRVGERQARRPRGPPTIEGRTHRGSLARSEVVAGGRRGQAGSPSEGVVRNVGCVERGGEGGLGDHRDVVSSGVEGRPPLIEEGGTDQREVASTEGQIVVPIAVLTQGGRALEEALRAGGLDRVRRVGGVDGPVSTLHRLARIVELSTRASMDAGSLGVTRAESGEQLAGGIEGCHVAVPGEQQVPT